MAHWITAVGEQGQPLHCEARVIRPLELVSHAIGAAGVSRLPAITQELVGAEKLWVGMTVLEPGARTGPHHHGDNETGVYLVAGWVRLRWGARLESEAELEVGDLVFVPPHLPHEESNPSIDEPAVWVVVWGARQVYVPLEPDADGVYGEYPAKPS
ncbi:MAG TPA: cupin domain-containing protein [Gemmataceae bacterium]|nr:cupin domain-containing protein [Gemmataceae bacterium]